MKKIIALLLIAMSFWTAVGYGLASNVNTNMTIVCESGREWVSDVNFMNVRNKKNKDRVRSYTESKMILRDGTQFGTTTRHYVWCDLSTLAIK